MQVSDVYNTILSQEYEIIEFIEGHVMNRGIDANVMKNPIWRVKKDNKELLLMYCEKDTICKLSQESYNIILNYEEKIGKKLTWYKGGNGYIYTTIHNPLKIYSIHQIIMDCYGNGKGTLNISVDHIDRDPLNNCLDNLRLATREEQEQNSKGIMNGTKRKRKNNAKPLPKGITQDMLEKYVVYYHEYDKKSKKIREFYKVESHPKLDKIWMTSKSEKVPIEDKRKQANKVVKDLENDIYPIKEEKICPDYVSLSNTHLVFDNRVNGNNGKMKLSRIIDDKEKLSDEDKVYVKEQLIKFNEFIMKKYKNKVSIFPTEPSL
jgi:hypothetical protein